MVHAAREGRFEHSLQGFQVGVKKSNAANMDKMQVAAIAGLFVIALPWLSGGVHKVDEGHTK